LSNASALASITDETGLTSVVAITPNRNAHIVGAARNSHAETPAARATINSDERVNFQKHRIPPRRMAKGKICIAINGNRSPAI
jgi:hypothetical protein